MIDPDPDILHSILAELKGVHARLDRIEQGLANRSPLSAEDRRKIDSLVPFLTDEVFSAKSLRDDALRTANKPLAAVLDLIGSQRSLGRLLARADEASYRIRRISSGNPSLWSRI